MEKSTYSLIVKKKTKANCTKEGTNFCSSGNWHRMSMSMRVE